MSDRRTKRLASIDFLEPRRLLATLPSGFSESLIGSLTSGTAMQFAPDGRLFVAQQGGALRIIKNGALLATPAVSLTVNSLGERGLLGIAFAPDFTSTQHVYLYYTTSTSPLKNRISRFTMSGDTVVAGSETILVELDNLSSATNHNGGAMNFGPDGKLYVAVGDNANTSNPQSLANRLGKMLRYNADGTIPTDNPTSFAGISGSTTGANRAIWAVGLRNPFTFAFHPTSGRMFINDVGQSTFEEVNEGGAGRNYGWPTTEGDFNQASFPNFTRPVYSYGRSVGRAITGGAFYVTSATNQFPSTYTGQYFLGDYVDSWIRTINPTTPPAVGGATGFATGAASIVDLKVGPDGALYYLQRGSPSGVRRITYTASLAPFILTQPSNQTVAEGQPVTFSVAAAGSGTLAYQWRRNGNDIAGANSSSYTFTPTLADTNSTYSVFVSNSAGNVTSNSATLTVTGNAAPTPTITSPNSGAFYSAGDTLFFSGNGTDPEDGTLPASAFEWQIDFHHDTHTHPALLPTAGVTSGSFAIPTQGETSANVFYRVYLRVTDSAGRTTETFRDVLPRTSVLTFTAGGISAGASMNLDGQPRAVPFNETGVAGVLRNLEAPATQVINGQTYNFVSWSNGGPRVQDISTPLTNTTYNVVYLDVTPPAIVQRDFAYANNPPSINVRFSENVGASIQPGDLTLQNLSTGQTVALNPGMLSYSSPNNLLTITPGLPMADGNYRLSVNGPGVEDAAGNDLSSATPFDFVYRLGDADNDGLVNFADLLIVSQNFGSTGRNFSQGDFTYDGTVDFADLLILAQRYEQPLVQARRRGKSLSADVL
jgi:glucose/arabinose dehydrogenase